jgi:glycine/D-amino acid oxidase-like deaminating enzyme/nitrite reductase/ring-hydroxylating ferredoxin subunit
MTLDKDRLNSLWQKEDQVTKFAPLGEDILIEVCVIGGGISGLTTAYQLAKRGHKVMLVDSFGLGSGQTGRTTAHLSSQLEKTFHEMLKIHSVEDVSLLYNAHRTAIDNLEHLITSEGIHCDFKRVDGYLFQGETDKIDFDQEINDGAKVGIDLVAVTEAPLIKRPALRFREQGQFNPLKFVDGLIKVLKELDVRMYEDTQILELNDDWPGPVMLKTDGGRSIVARHVVVATDSPISNRVAIHMKQHAYRSYAMSFKLPKEVEDVLLWDTEDPYHYIRVYDNELIVGGEDHRTGHQPKHDPFKVLEEWARENFTFIGEVSAKWSAQLFGPTDQIPFIGKAPDTACSVYIITGLSGIGMTGGTIGSMVIPSLIEEHDHKWAKLLDPSRAIKGRIVDYIKENFTSTLPYTDWIRPAEVSDISKIPEDSGAIVRQGLMRSCVYHESGDNFEKKSAICTHLGGIVHWNDFEKTWDCPCHGSRFNVHGRTIEGPALTDLTERK